MKKDCLLRHGITIASVICALSLLISCGSGGGDGGDAATPTSSGTTTTGNLTGNVFNSLGLPVSGASVSAFSAVATATTDADGAFSFSLSKAVHSLLISRAGSVDCFRTVDLSSGVTLDNPILLRDTVVPSNSVLAGTGTLLPITSNTIDGKAATLDVPVQASGTFSVGTQTGLTTASISLEYLDLHDPIPVPLPSIATRSAALNAVLGVDKQAPSVLVAVRPALLNMGTAATLTIPNNVWDALPAGTRILRFDVESHVWVDTNIVVDGTPADGTDVQITAGGVYGIFYETARVSAVKGTGIAGSVVFMGDQSAVVQADGKFYLEDVPIPPAGSGALNVSIVDPATNSSTPSSVTPIANQVVEMEQTQTTVSAIAIASGSQELVADGVTSTTVTATVTDSGGSPVNGIVVNFTSSAGTPTAASATTANGVAAFTLTSPTIAGTTATVRASAQGVSSSHLLVSFVPGSVASVVLSAVPSNLAADGTSTSALRADVRDAHGNAVTDGEVIRFTVTTGSGTVAPPTAATSGGVAEVSYTASYTVGTETVTAESANGYTDTVNITLAGTAVNSVTVTSGTGTLVADSVTTTIIRATVLDTNGAGVPGETVAFATTLGTLSSPTDVTNSNGNAEVTLETGTTVGTATVTATASGFGNQVAVQFVAGAPSTVTVSAAPSSVNPNGTTTVTATVLDANANAVVGETVNFSVPTNGSGGAIQTLTVATNVNGQASSAYVAGNVAGTDVLKATAASNGKNNTTTVTVSATSVVVGSITVAAGTGSLVADGVSSTLIRATVLNTSGGAASGVTVTFATTLGTFTTPATAVTNAAGIAEATLKSGTTVGTATVTGSASGFSSQAAVVFAAGAPATVTLTAAPSTVNPADSTTVTAVVKDTNSNPVVGETVNFSVSTNNSGGSLGNVSAVTNVNGEASVTYTAGSTAGSDTLKATAASNGTNNTATVTVSATAVVVGSISVAAGASSLVADGAGSTLIRATVTDTSSEAAPGVTVTFATTLGTFTTSTTGVTNSAGIAEATLKTGTTVGTATVTATASGFSSRVSVQFVAGAPSTVTVTAAPATVNPGNDTTLTAVVVDSNGNALVGETVNFGVPTNNTGGSLGIVSATTNVNGEASVTYTAGSTSGTDTLKATAASNGVNGTTPVVVSVTSVVVGAVLVEAGASSLVADGTSSTLIRATVTDTSSEAAPGVTVTFATTLGTFTTSTTVVTDSAGIAEATLKTGTMVGTATVTVTASGFSSRVNVQFVAGAPSTVTVTAAPATVNPGDGTTLTAVVADGNGNAVVGETVNFSVTTNNSGGTLAAVTAVTNVNGEASVIYTAGSTPGTDTVKATAAGNGINGITPVTVDATAMVVGSLSVAAGAGSLTADGTSSTLIRATVLDTSSEPAPGVTVTFATTLGTFPTSTTGVTNSAGIAEATLKTGTTVGTASVTATASGFSSRVSVQFVAGAPATVTVTAAPATVNPGNDTTLTAVVVDSNGNALVGETVNFGVPTNNTGGSLGIVSATTNVNGEASVTYTAGSTPGTDIVKATVASNGASGTTPVVVNATSVVVGSITVEAGASSLTADNASSTLIRATVADTSSEPAPGVTVTFATTLGTFTTSTSVMTDAAGIAEATLKTGTTVGTAAVTATASGFSGRVSVQFVAGAPATVAVTAAPATVNPSGTSTITATVVDATGNPVVGETVNFNATVNNSGGSFAGLSAVTNVNGRASVGYTAGTTSGVSDTIEAAAASNGVANTASIAVDATAVVVGSISVAAGAASITADGASTTAIRATLLDTASEPAGGITVAFSTTAGSLSAATAATDTNGIAQVTLTSSTHLGQATVTASASGFSSAASVTFIPGAPDSVSLSASPGNLTADGTSRSVITAVVLDEYDNPVADDSTVTFSALEGNLDNLTVTTSGGVASTSYTAPSARPESGRDTITATTTNGKSGTVSITLIGSQIASISLTANPTSLPQGGNSQATITAEVTIVGGGSAPDGTEVSFSIVQGDGGIDSTASTSGGVAIATLTSGNAEYAVIRAEAGGRTSEVQVDYTPGSVSLTIVPNSVLGTGTKTATVTATVETAEGAAYTGAVVAFVISDQSMGIIDSTGTEVSDSGQYTALFRAGTVGGTVTVTASTSINGSEVSGSNTIEIQPPPAFITVAEGSPDPAAISIKGTGGQATSQVTFDVKDSLGALVADGYRIDFSILSSPDGGEEISPLFATTVSGQVSTILRSGFKSGPVSIKATYFNDSNISTTTGQISIAAGPPVGEEFGIARQYANISGLRIMGLEDVVTVNAGDIYGNAIPDGTSISFKTNNTGGIFDPGSSSTEGGFAQSSLFSVDNPTPAQGFVSVTAEAVNGGRTTHVTTMAVNPGDRSVIYAGTDGGGVYKSTDSGASWNNVSRSSTEPGQNWINPYVNELSIDPDDPDAVYAATGYLGAGALYRSLDGGASWNSNHEEQVFGLFQSTSAVLTVLCDDGGSDYVWTGTQGQGAWFAADGASFNVGGKTTPTGNTTSGGIGFQNLVFNVGDGEMSEPILSEVSKTESWEVLYDGSVWWVYGSVSGLQTNKATTGYWYETDNEELRFAISNGATPFALGDEFTFDVLESGLGHGKSVRAIVKAPAGGTGASAVIYAGTGTGVFRSSNGGITWHDYSDLNDDDTQGAGENNLSFLGDNVSTIAIHPASDGVTDYLYVGTADAGVWAYTTAAAGWTNYTSGMGKGLSASTPVSSITNAGNGIMGDVTAYDDALTETWTVACKTAATNGGTFSVTGTVTGAAADYDISAGAYTLAGKLAFTITDGTVDFAVGDTFTFKTTRDPGREIKDLLLDSGNNKLYALTYFWGAEEPHAVGNVFVINLDPASRMPTGSWSEANTGLPQYYPPDDVTLFAQHVITADDETSPSALFVGGEGINMYKAVTGVSAGTPSWQKSMTGLTNLIMARSLVLFSGTCHMDVAESVVSGYTDVYNYTIYVQDENGNPPISGSTFSVITYDVDGAEVARHISVLYGDELTSQGTYRDPSDVSTDYPYTTTVDFSGVVVKAEFSFFPACQSTVPGCSGGSQIESKLH